MADIIGSIGPAPEHRITESPSFTEPTRTLNVFDPSGNKHGRVEWVASEVDQAFLDALNTLCATAMGVRAVSHSPSAAAP